MRLLSGKYRPAAFCALRGVIYETRSKWSNVFALLVYAAIICIAARIIKYFIRYGIDYYFEKLAEYQKNQKNTED